MPLAVSRQNAAPTSTSDGNSLGGNTPSRAVISQATARTRNGNAVRAATRQRDSCAGRADAPIRVCAELAGRSVIDEMVALVGVQASRLDRMRRAHR